jgi:hypothetical protein
VGPDRIEVTHPLIFGRAFLFDGLRRVVTIRRCALGITLSKQEMPFSEFTLHKRRVVTDRGPYGGDVSYRVDMNARGERFHIGFWGFDQRATRVLTALRRLLKVSAGVSQSGSPSPH